MTGTQPAPPPTDTSDPVVQDYRKHLYEALHSASRDYDQAILTLGAATLALSVTFAHNITPTPVAGTQAILLIAWAALVLSMIFIVASFLTSQRTIRLAIRAIDAPTATASTRIARVVAVFDRLVAPVTGLLNLFAGGFLIVGLAMLGWYALANVSPSPPITPAPTASLAPATP